MQENSGTGSGLAKEHFCEIISKSVNWFGRGSCLKLFFYSKPWRPSCSTEQNGLSNFGGQSPKEHSCIFF